MGVLCILDYVDGLILSQVLDHVGAPIESKCVVYVNRLLEGPVRGTSLEDVDLHNSLIGLRKYFVV